MSLSLYVRCCVDKGIHYYELQCLMCQQLYTETSKQVHTGFYPITFIHRANLKMMHGEYTCMTSLGFYKYVQSQPQYFFPHPRHEYGVCGLHDSGTEASTINKQLRAASIR